MNHVHARHRGPEVTQRKLRSARWFEPDDLRSFGHRSRARQMGYDETDWAGKSVIAILNTWSDINPCHAHFRHRVENVKRGVLQAGGFPLELPALSLPENFVKPTTMLYRNLLAMEAEELIRSHPVDGAVLMGGCDKTTPGLVMGAFSAGLPMIYLPAGPMLRGNFRGEALGSGSDGWKYWDERRAGNLSAEDWAGVEGGIARSYGHCMTMGTASTMTAVAEALGLTLPGASSIPAADSNRIRMATACGRRIVEMVNEDLRPERIVDRRAVDNALTVAMALGCSTNAIVHLIAMARRAGVALDLDDFDRASRTTPMIANIRPSGERYLMEDFGSSEATGGCSRSTSVRRTKGATSTSWRPASAPLWPSPISTDGVPANCARSTRTVSEGNLSSAVDSRAGIAPVGPGERSPCPSSPRISATRASGPARPCA